MLSSSCCISAPWRTAAAHTANRKRRDYGMRSTVHFVELLSVFSVFGILWRQFVSWISRGTTRRVMLCDRSDRDVLLNQTLTVNVTITRSVVCRRPSSRATDLDEVSCSFWRTLTDHTSQWRVIYAFLRGRLHRNGITLDKYCVYNETLWDGDCIETELH